MYWRPSCKEERSNQSGIIEHGWVSFWDSQSSTCLLLLLSVTSTRDMLTQYHLMFDDKFETIFNDGTSSVELDRICNELIVISRDCYVEEEYDYDGILIDKPPLLDEVWLSEPGQHEMQQELE